MRRSFLPVLVCTAALWGAGTAPAAVLVRDHQPAASIVVARDASPQVVAAARRLQDYIHRATGAMLPLGSSPGPGVVIEVGATDFVRAHDPRPEGLDEDGFVLDGSMPGHFVIAGGSDWGTEFGVDEFLERYLGVCWLMPTAAGEDVPASATLETPTGRDVQQPVYLSRQLSPLDIDEGGINMTVRAIDPFFAFPHPRNDANNRWGRLNRVRGRIAFHHNLVELFAPSVFAESHPEFYPMINGQRLVPLAVKGYTLPRWQPNFSAPGIVDAAARRIVEYFDTHPAAPSYSLGMNDNSGFDQSPASRARRNGRKNYLGFEDVSDDYFEWADAVATKVGERYPTKWFGTLAYEGIGDPPTRVPVHPRIVPFLTYDRMRWGDPKLRMAGEALTKRWTAVAPGLGWYDYTYGAQYLVPRVWFHRMQDYLAWGADHGVRSHYAELYPNWGEGPKAWIFAKLLWNPHQDVDALLDTWYRHAVGPLAAPKLKAFYALWEQFWEKDVFHSRWNRDTGQYLLFSDPSYLLDIPEETVTRADALMAAVVAGADTRERQARAAALARMWEFYRLSYATYRGHRQIEEMPVKSAQDALALLGAAEKTIRESRRRRELLGSFADDPLNALVEHVIGYMYRYSLLGEGWGAAPAWRVLPWLASAGDVRARLEAWAGSDDPDVRRVARTILSAAATPASGLLKNADFRSGLDGWTFTGLTGPEAEKFRAVAGPRDVTFSGSGGGSLAQTIPYAAGDYYVVLRARAGAALREGKVTLSMTALNELGATERGRDGRRFYLPSAKLVTRTGEPAVLAISFHPPPSAGIATQLRVNVAFSEFTADDCVTLERLDIFGENDP